MRCNVASPAKIDIDNELATEIFRIFQEALTNVARHAEATEVDVSLSDDDGKMVLEVRDNGRGITEEEVNSSKSIGLIGIRERAYSLNGELEIISKSGKGSRIIASFPLGEDK